MNFKIEICVDTVESAILAQDAGADRIELCSSLLEGGITPGTGTISSARKNLTIALNVIIRPRGGDFLYNNIDYEIMKKDIDICGECGADGIVTGILKPDGDIDIERTYKLIEHARPMSVTFHRAFDMCNDPLKGLEDVIATGADRLLTSGQKNKAEDGMELLLQLSKLADGRIIIMPGSGINESNILSIARETNAQEFHLTGRKTIYSEMIFKMLNISMGGSPSLSEFSRKVVDHDMIKRIINDLRRI
jgi:copper homeostasis protein